LETLEGEQ